MKRPIPSSIEAEQRVQTLTVVADLQAPKIFTKTNTSTSPLKMGPSQKETSLSTSHFQGILVSGRVTFTKTVVVVVC